MAGARREHRGRGDDRRRGERRRHRHRHDDCDRDGRDSDRGGGGDYDEKRIIDTIVHLVVENLDRQLQDRWARSQHRDGGDEKRIIDLIVGLVSEHVQEIVATELDRRLGRPALPEAEEGPEDGDED